MTAKHIRWCWDNGYYADVMPLPSEKGKMNPLVRIELSKRGYKNGKLHNRTIQVGKNVFKGTETDKIYAEANRVYELIYKKYKDERQ